MHCRISPRRMCNPCGHTVKIGSRHHRLLTYDAKRNTNIDGIGPFKGELTKNFLFLFSLDQVSLISLLKYFPPKMSLT